MSNHKGRQLLFRNNLIDQIKYGLRCFRIQRSRRFIQQKNFRTAHGGHKQSYRLALSAGKQTDSRRHPVFQSKSQSGYQVLIMLFSARCKCPAESVAKSAPVSQHQIFLKLHSCCCPLHRILENAADIFSPFVFRHSGNILAINFNQSLIWDKRACNQVKQRTLSSAITSDNRTEVPIIQCQ